MEIAVRRERSYGEFDIPLLELAYDRLFSFLLRLANWGQRMARGGVRRGREEEGDGKGK